MTEEANHLVRTIAKSLALIERLDDLHGARIVDLEAEVDVTKGAIHNHLSTLHEHGYVLSRTGTSTDSACGFSPLAVAPGGGIPTTRSAAPRLTGSTTTWGCSGT